MGKFNYAWCDSFFPTLKVYSGPSVISIIDTRYHPLANANLVHIVTDDALFLDRN